MVFLKKCDPELSCILAEVFDMCLKESCFPDCWKVLSLGSVFKNVGQMSLVIKVVEKLVDKALVSSPQEMWPFFRFPKMVLGLLDQPKIF